MLALVPHDCQVYRIKRPLTAALDDTNWVKLDQGVVANLFLCHAVQVCLLYSLLSKAIRMGSVLETTTFSSQSGTILVASLLLYVFFLDLNRFLVVCISGSTFS